MVSPVKFAFRFAHIAGAMTICALNAYVLLATDAQATQRTATIAAGLLNKSPVVFDRVFLGEIIGGIVLIAGIINAILLRPKSVLPPTGPLATWRGMIYGLKTVLFILCTPVSNKIVGGLLSSSASGASAEVDVVRGAAAIKLVAIIAATAVGAFARFYREENSTAVIPSKPKKV